MKHIIVSLIISFILYLIFAIYNVTFNISLWFEISRFGFSFLLGLILFVNIAIYIEKNK